ncbi:hypothetical protein [Rhodococcus sp. JVH1]|uniref:hypothetical protein n=1 Tax=Rhodococcus sp. JVH1 TaxID=745408 RepID=UPI000272181D|nr:hypothetical protein [Rhodococcus sp. JVH1]EJI95782.1 hypothetical protein JVH1_6803 [Rhodococcus sp. JVH1]
MAKNADAAAQARFLGLVREGSAEAIVGVKVGPGANQHENYLAEKGVLRRFGYVAAAENLTNSETPTYRP